MDNILFGWVFSRNGYLQTIYCKTPYLRFRRQNYGSTHQNAIVSKWQVDYFMQYNTIISLNINALNRMNKNRKVDISELKVNHYICKIK